LSETDDHTDVSVIAPQVSNAAVSMTRSSFTTDDTVTLNFKRVVGENPEKLNLMYAIGMSSELGIHTTRKCFVIDAFSTCSSLSGEVTGNADSMKMENAQLQSTLGSSSALMSTFSTLFFSCMLGAAVWF